MSIAEPPRTPGAPPPSARGLKLLNLYMRAEAIEALAALAAVHNMSAGGFAGEVVGAVLRDAGFEGPIGPRRRGPRRRVRDAQDRATASI